MSTAIDKLQDLWNAWDQGSMIGMADTINAIRPALDEMTAARAEIARLTAELAAARAVPGDVEAALHNAECRNCGNSWFSDDQADLFRTAIARAIRDATAAATEAFKRGMRRVFKCSAHEVDPTKAWGCPDCLAELRRATAARGTVGGQAGPVGDVADADPATRGPLPKGGLPATQRCSKCRGVPSHTPGGIPCDECGLIGSMPWGG